MPRFDSLTPVHKAVRALVYAGGGALQTTDFADEQSALGASEELVSVLHLMQDHHDTEEKYFYPDLEPLEPELVAEMLGQHMDVVRLLGVTDAARLQVATVDGERRMAAGSDLNRRFNELTAFYLEHLAEEEARVLPAMWRHFDDERLMGIQGRIIGEMDPDLLFQWLGWMFKGLSRAELVGLLSGAKMGMPPEALDAVRAMGASSMDPARWEVVRQQAGL